MMIADFNREDIQSSTKLDQTSQKWNPLRLKIPYVQYSFTKNIVVDTIKSELVGIPEAFELILLAILIAFSLQQLLSLNLNISKMLSNREPRQLQLIAAPLLTPLIVNSILFTAHICLIFCLCK